MRIFLHNQKSEIFPSLKTVFIKTDDGLHSYAIKKARPAGDHYLMGLSNVTTREQADRFKGGVLFVPRSSLPELDGDEFYVDDLIGLEAFEGDHLLGKIFSSREAGGVEIVTVRDSQEEMEIPLVEDFVVQMDISGGRILFHDTELLPRNKIGRSRRR